MTDAYVALSGPPTWHEAACRGHDPELWFADEQKAVARLMRDQAKTICGGCAMIAECLTFAVDNHIPFGIFGGRTAHERHKQTRRQNRKRGRYVRRSNLPTVEDDCDHCNQLYLRPISWPSQKYCGPVCAEAAHRRKKAASERERRRLSRQGAV